VIDDGHILEQGTHDELLAAGGLYRELYLTQYARVASPVTEPVATPVGE
jgi:ATP-binding cassette subfamily B protein